jgi:hypothetical protein
MSDIADKIYAATGLTLNAEAATVIGHMIRLARQEAADEIEKLRVALKKISVTARRKDETPEALLVVCDAIARAPLGEGP